MRPNREQIAAWLDSYFRAANDKQGPLESVVELRRFFTDDFEFFMFTPPPFLSPPLNRQELLMTFVHPSIHERLTPNYYTIDTENMVAVVQFELCFTHKDSGRTWRPLQASAHYHLQLDTDGAIRIRRINYWTESHRPGDDFDSLFELWAKDRQAAVTEFAAEFLRGAKA